MGTYDDIHVGDKVGQVKLWPCQLVDYEVGDETPAFDDATYSIAMREGGYVHVVRDHVSGWEDSPLPGAPTYDKWGGPLGKGSVGILGEGYFFGEAS